MTWRNYEVTYHYSHKDEPPPNRHVTRRYIRAVSRDDAEWRAARKFILPKNARVVNVEVVQ